jgi:hypothetical protein
MEVIRKVLLFVAQFCFAFRSADASRGHLDEDGWKRGQRKMTFFVAL